MYGQQLRRQHAIGRTTGVLRAFVRMNAMQRLRYDVEVMYEISG